MMLAVLGVELPSMDDGRGEGKAGPTLPLKEEKANQISLEQVIIIRIPRASVAAHSASSFSGERSTACLPTSSLSGVRISRAGEMDLLTTNGWYRAELDESCDARLFYSGFYIEKPKDGRLCSHRDEMRSRSGSVCQVESFIRL